MRHPHQAALPQKSIEIVGGGSNQVTPSLSILRSGASSIAIDCGCNYGDEDSSRLNPGISDQRMERVFKTTDQVLLTHAHMDHTGGLPRAFALGLSPDIYTTGVTADLLELMWNDASKIESHRFCPEFGEHDVNRALNHVHVVKHNHPVEVGSKNRPLTATWSTSGHNVDASSILIDDVLFTGDIGKENQALCGGYESDARQFPLDPVRVVVSESTNADRIPIPWEEKQKIFLDTIIKTWEGGGTPIFGTFAYGRTQELLEMALNSIRDGLLDKDTEVILDARLGAKILDVFVKYSGECLTRQYGNNPNYYPDEKASSERFNSPNLLVVESHKASQIIAGLHANCPLKTVGIVGGGMGVGPILNWEGGPFGRNPKNVIAYPGYLCKGTRAADLAEKGNIRTWVRMTDNEEDTRHNNRERRRYDSEDNTGMGHLEHHPKNREDADWEQKGSNANGHGAHKEKKPSALKRPREQVDGAKVIRLPGFTGHASGQELIDYLEHYNIGGELAGNRVEKIIINHGPEEGRKALADMIKAKGFSAEVILPENGQVVEI